MDPQTSVRIEFVDNSLFRALEPFESLFGVGLVLSFISWFVIAAVQSWFERRERLPPHTEQPNVPWVLVYSAGVACFLVCLGGLGLLVNNAPHPKDVDVVRAIETHYDVTYVSGDASEANPYQPNHGNRSSAWGDSFSYTLRTKGNRTLHDCRTHGIGPYAGNFYVDITVICGDQPLPRVR